MHISRLNAAWLAGVLLVGRAWAATPFDDVGLDADSAEPRFYVTGILGESFATLAEPIHRDLVGQSVNGSIITAGGAAGIAFARDGGQWRLEVEGRGRDDLTAVQQAGLPPLLAANFAWAAADGWSAMANVWHDWWIDERWAVYAGGGLGAGGYRYSLAGQVQLLDVGLNVAGNDQVAEFAWQAGCGIVYEVTERISIDVGYRFFSIGQADSTYTLTAPEGESLSLPVPQQFTAGEILVGLRVYEPFRRWR